MKILYYILFLFFIHCGVSIQKYNSNFDRNSNYNYSYYKADQKPQGIIIQLDPLSFSVDVLEEFWIPFWIKQNYEVLQIQQKEKKLISPEELHFLLKEIFDNFSFEENVILAGLSLNGISVLDWIASEKFHPHIIKKIIIIGSGFDYNYKGNLFYEKPEYLNHTITNLNYEIDAKYNNWINNFYVPEIPIKNKNTALLPERNLPILFVIGKIDSFAPEDSIIPFVKNYGKNRNCKVSTIIHRCNYYIEASRGNFFDKDYHHFDLFLYKNVQTDLYKEILNWVKIK